MWTGDCKKSAWRTITHSDNAKPTTPVRISDHAFINRDQICRADCRWVLKANESTTECKCVPGIVSNSFKNWKTRNAISDRLSSLAHSPSSPSGPPLLTCEGLMGMSKSPSDTHDPNSLAVHPVIGWCMGRAVAEPMPVFLADVSVGNYRVIVDNLTLNKHTGTYTGARAAISSVCLLRDLCDQRVFGL